MTGFVICDIKILKFVYAYKSGTASIAFIDTRVW